MSAYTLNRTQTRELMLLEYQHMLYEGELLDRAKAGFDKLVKIGDVALDSKAAAGLAWALKKGGVNISAYSNLVNAYKNLHKVIALAKDKNIHTVDKLLPMLKTLGIKSDPKKFFIQIAFAAIPGGKLGLIGANLAKSLASLGYDKLASSINAEMRSVHNKVFEKAEESVKQVAAAELERQIDNAQGLPMVAMNYKKQKASNDMTSLAEKLNKDIKQGKKMKLTKQQLANLINEEIEQLHQEGFLKNVGAAAAGAFVPGGRVALDYMRSRGFDKVYEKLEELERRINQLEMSR